MTDTLMDRSPTELQPFDADIQPETLVPTGPRRRRPVLLTLCFAWLCIVVLSAVTADWLPIQDPNVDVGHGVRTAPFQVWAEPLGTDGLGRSELSRLIYGARVSLFAALVATCIALTAGLLVGITAGYFRGRVDSVLSVIIDAVLAFPGLVLLLALTAVLQPSIQTVIIGLSIFGWVGFARLSRANTMQVATSDYVTASRGLGAKSRTTLVREILPNVTSTVITLAGLVVGGLILAEASLSFLGLGVRPPTPSWGSMIADARTNLSDHPYLMFVPAIILFLTIFSVNFIGDWLRTRSDPASKL
ncbi:MAG: ABC transporter permease [Acidimicrobiia bacterium]